MLITLLYSLCCPPFSMYLFTLCIFRCRFSVSGNAAKRASISAASEYLHIFCPETKQIDHRGFISLVSQRSKTILSSESSPWLQLLLGAPCVQILFTSLFIIMFFIFLLSSAQPSPGPLSLPVGSARANTNSPPSRAPPALTSSRLIRFACIFLNI